METIQKKSASFKGIKSAGWVIVICFIVAVLIFHFVLGNPSNFMNNDPNNHPLPGNFLGTIYKGGFIVPVIQTLLLTVIALSIERYIAIGAAFLYFSHNISFLLVFRSSLQRSNQVIPVLSEVLK